jgi:hypothetical protein
MTRFAGPLEWAITLLGEMRESRIMICHQKDYIVTAELRFIGGQ